MYPVPGKKIWPKNEALTVSAANPKSRSREKTSEKIKVNLHSKGERRYPFTDVLITDGFKKPVQIRLKTNPVIDRFCKIYPGAQAILHAGICYLFSSSRSCRAGRLPAGHLIPRFRFLRIPGSRFLRVPGPGFSGYQGPGFSGHPGPGFSGHQGPGFSGHQGPGFSGHPVHPWSPRTSSMEPADFFRREQEQMRMNMVF